MKRAILILVATALAGAALATPAQGFGIEGLEAIVTASPGHNPGDAGSHPLALTTRGAVETETDPVLGKIPAGQLRDLTVELPPGLVGSPYATPRCAGVDFAVHVIVASGFALPNCSTSSVVGLISVHAATSEGSPLEFRVPLYNLFPPPGKAARFGFVAPLVGTPVTFDAEVKETPPYNVIAKVSNATQTARVFSTEATLWGNPSDPSHDSERGRCGFFVKEGITTVKPGGSCPTSSPNLPFLTLPRSCSGPLAFDFEAISWLGDVSRASAMSQDSLGEPLGVGGCSKLDFGPRLSAQPTSQSASAPSGLDFDLNVDDEGLTGPDGVAASDIQKAVVTLPKGMTVNPSQAEGLEACSEKQLARERPDSQFGNGCPAASKIGTVEVETPLLEGTTLHGSLFVAEPYKNRFGTLIALFMTVVEPKLGVIFKIAGRVEPDPHTGQLVASFDEIPQWPFSHFHLHFREGDRSPLVTPPLCGAYTTIGRFTPSGDPTHPFTATSSFDISTGVGGSPCPKGGTPPFEPGFSAGTLNNDAGRYSPLYMRLTRRDGDQDMTRFTSKLPQGLVGRLAGVDRCPDAQIAIAKAKSGKAELASPSCPANSQIGTVLAGAGVGSQLTYVTGRLYLAGPLNGAPFSVVAIVPAVAGPFDVGTVVVRQALAIDPRTAQVTADGSRSDPIPHILAGIPLTVRDLRVSVDRSGFTLNPTSCDPSQFGAELWGGGSDPFSGADDFSLSLSDRFQAAGCAALGFKPRLSLNLQGATARGGHPRLRGIFRPREGDANLEGLQLRLPHSAFLDQGHIRTICTRVQFAADACPEGAVYGRARAITPLLSKPLEGPVYLRSSNHQLPDLVFDLHGQVDFEAVARIDSRHGGIRATFTNLPDAPVSKVIVHMLGARKGLIVNSTDLCLAQHAAAARMSAHNGKQRMIEPPLRADCGR